MTLRPWQIWSAIACGVAILLDIPHRLILPWLHSLLQVVARTAWLGDFLHPFAEFIVPSLLVLPPLLASSLCSRKCKRGNTLLLLDAIALAGLFMVTPTMMTSAMRLGWTEGAALAERDRRAEGHPPRPIKPAPNLPQWAQDGVTALSLTALAFLLLRRSRRHEDHAEALKDQALRAKLAPHFIFNTLNTLKAQIAADPLAAEATTDRLASLFRQVVQVADQPTIPLRQELAFVEAYLGIEQARLGDRLRVVMDIPEALEDLPVPPLSLQVLVENAVKHGVAPREAGGQIRIRAVDRRPEGLWLEVIDPGDGTTATPSGTGTALSTLRQRLARPEDLSLEPTSQGFRASLLWRHPQTRNLA